MMQHRDPAPEQRPAHPAAIRDANSPRGLGPLWPWPGRGTTAALLLAALLLPSVIWPARLAAQTATTAMVETSAGPLELRQIASGLETPWAFGFLPDGAIVVTERGGRLLLLHNGTAESISGLPKLRAMGQGGLLDVMVPRNFSETRQIWLSFSGETGEGLATMAGRGRLSEDGRQLEGFETLFTATPSSGGRHFGARLVEREDGGVYLTTGDRGTGPEGQAAQDPRNSIGVVVRLSPSGEPQAAQPDWAPGVHSIGHRNIQGATLMPDGGLLVSEHGARGGDEINRVEPGGNYGWPVISYGVNYNGNRIGSGTKAAGMAQPLHYWDPSIAPSGLMVYSGRLVPAWRGDVFAGSLNSDFISRLDPDTPAATGWAEERISAPQTARVRDLREGPDGAIWFLSESRGGLYRLAPAAP